MSVKIHEIVISISDIEALRLLNHPYKGKIHEKANCKLVSEFLQWNPDKWKEYQRFRSTNFVENKHINVAKESVLWKNIKITSCGAANRLKEARNIASSELINKILEIDPALHMPLCVIGMSNYRGHCFFVPAFVPLFNILPFVKTLLHGFDLSCKYIETYGKKKPESIAARSSTPDGEPFLWTRIVKKFYNRYRAASFSGQLDIRNVPTGAGKRYTNNDLLKNFNTPKTPGKKDELLIDKSMMKICLELAQFADPDYLEPSGWTVDLLRNVLTRMDEEYIVTGKVSPFYEIMVSHFFCTYSCNKCGQQSLRKCLKASIIPIPFCSESIESLQDICNEPLRLFTNLESDWNHMAEGERCSGEITKVFNINISNLPKIIIFETTNVKKITKDHHYLLIPEELTIANIKYKKVAFSLYFQCLENRKPRMYPRKPNEKGKGWHTCVMILTSEGWFEVNNHLVFTPLDLRYDQLSPHNVIFYQKIDEQLILPKPGNYFDDDNNFFQKVFSNENYEPVEDMEID